VVNEAAASAGWWWIVPVVLVVLTAAGLRIYLPAAREVLVRGEGRVGTWWVGHLDGLVTLVLVGWFLLLGRDALVGGDERVVEFRHVVSGAAIYGAILLFLTGLLLYRDFRPAAGSVGGGGGGGPTWWVGHLDGLVTLVLVGWFLLLGRDA
jgi:hypothetical protein